MKFLLDQSTDARLGVYLYKNGHDVTRIGTHHPSGIKDEEVLSIAFSEKRILLTEDSDFEKLVFEQDQPHMGVIHLRFGKYTKIETKIEILKNVVENHANDLSQFLVATLKEVDVKKVN